MTLLEVCHWGLGFHISKAHAIPVSVSPSPLLIPLSPLFSSSYPPPLSFCLMPVDQDVGSQLLIQCHALLPAAIMGSNPLEP